MHCLFVCFFLFQVGIAHAHHMMMNGWAGQNNGVAEHVSEARYLKQLQKDIINKKREVSFAKRELKRYRFNQNDCPMERTRYD